MEFRKVGTLLKPRGLDGEIRIYVITDFSEIRFNVGNTLYLHNVKKDKKLKVTVASFKVHKGNIAFIRFMELQTLEQIEVWRGAEVLGEQFDELPDDYVYRDEIIGSTVIFEGELIGVVIELEEYAPYLSLRVQLTDKKRSILIPYIDEFVSETDTDQKQITVKGIAALL